MVGEPGIPHGRLLRDGLAPQLHGRGLAAALAGGRAYFGHYENEVQCVDLAEGKKLWTFKVRDGAFFSSPALTGDRVIIGCRDRRVHCLDRATGKELWRTSVIALPGDPNSTTWGIVPPEERVLLLRPRLSRIYFLRRFFDYPVSLSASRRSLVGSESMAQSSMNLE